MTEPRTTEFLVRTEDPTAAGAVVAAIEATIDRRAIVGRWTIQQVAPDAWSVKVEAIYATPREYGLISADAHRAALRVAPCDLVHL